MIHSRSYTWRGGNGSGNGGFYNQGEGSGRGAGHGLSDCFGMASGEATGRGRRCDHPDGVLRAYAGGISQGNRQGNGSIPGPPKIVEVG